MFLGRGTVEFPPCPSLKVHPGFPCFPLASGCGQWCAQCLPSPVLLTAVPCVCACPYPCHSELNLAISVPCSRCKPTSLALPQPAPRTDRQIGYSANRQNFFHGQKHPDTKTTRNISCLALLGHACLMDFLVATKNCEISSHSIIIKSIEGSHMCLCSLLQLLFENKNSSWQVLWGKYKGQMLSPWMRAVRRREGQHFPAWTFLTASASPFPAQKKRAMLWGLQKCFLVMSKRNRSSFSLC